LHFEFRGLNGCVAGFAGWTAVMPSSTIATLGMSTWRNSLPTPVRRSGRWQRWLSGDGCRADGCRLASSPGGTQNGGVFLCSVLASMAAGLIVLITDWFVPARFSRRWSGTMRHWSG
jgi:hypothetical protein